MRVLTARHAKLSDITYSADSGMLFVAGWSHAPEETGLQVWDLGSERSQAALHHDGSQVEWVRRLGSGRLLLGLWNPPTGDVVLATAGPRGESLKKMPIRILQRAAVAHSPVADRFAVFGWGADGTELKCFQLDRRGNAGQLWVHRYHPKPAFGHAVEFEATGEGVLSVEWRPGGSPEFTARWLSADTGEVIGDPMRLVNEVTHAQLTPDGYRLIVLTESHLRSFDLTNPKARPVKRERGYAAELTVHPDGRRVFVTGTDGVLREYDTTTLQELRAYDWQIGKLQCVAIAPDGATAAAVGSDTGKVVVWDLE